MKLASYKAEIIKIIEQRNGYLLLSGGLLFLCVLLSCLAISLSHRERVVLVPPSMQSDVWISNNSVSPDYLSRMTLFLAEMALNVTADNVDFQQEVLMRYVDPSYFMTLKPQLVARADHIKKEHITTVFFPVDIKVDLKHLEVQIVGDLKSYVGDLTLPSKRVSYRFIYRLNTFTPLITLFEEVKND